MEPASTGPQGQAGIYLNGDYYAMGGGNEYVLNATFGDVDVCITVES